MYYAAPNVGLRNITEADTDNIIRWRNDPSTYQYFIYRETFTTKTQLEWLQKYVATGKVVQFIIVDNEKNVDIGSAYFRDIDYNNKKCEYGIFIGEVSYRGLGLGKIISEWMINYAFNELKMNKVFLRVFSSNLRAIKAYENAGFLYEGTARQDVIINDIAQDITFMSVLKDEWKGVIL